MSNHLTQAIHDCIAACNDCVTECGNCLSHMLKQASQMTIPPVVSSAPKLAADVRLLVAQWRPV